jgi:hypothetical protein
MLAQASEPVIAAQQAVFFDLYVTRCRLVSRQTGRSRYQCRPAGASVYLPRGEFRIHDPDAYGVTVAQHD